MKERKRVKIVLVHFMLKSHSIHSIQCRYKNKWKKRTQQTITIWNKWCLYPELIVMLFDDSKCISMIFNGFHNDFEKKIQQIFFQRHEKMNENQC